MLTLFEIVGLAAAAWLVGYGAYHLAGAIAELRGKRIVNCPETGRPVAVDLDVRYSAAHSLVGRPHFRLKDCSRWPEKAGCGQMCLGDVEASPHDCLVRSILSRWYAGKRCVYCHHVFGDVHWHDRKPALRGADGVTREWSEFPAETIPEVLQTHEPVCWNCHIAETFRRERPDLFIDRPPRPMPPMM